MIKDKLTIVIPCKNEKETLLETLRCIKNQKGLEDIKIIIADCSTDNTRSLVDLYNQSVKLNIEFVEGGMPAIARNNGAKLVKTPYILFLDSDVHIYEPSVISNCLADSIKYDLHLITCKYETDKEYNWVFRIFDIFQRFSAKTKPFAMGGFMLFKTNVFNQLKGFNEEDKIAEDYHLSSKIKPSLFKISSDFIYTSSRRFNKKGVWYMIKLALNSWINRNNNDWFKRDYNYWK